MTKGRSATDIPIKSAVIAWQPALARRYEGDAAAGEVAVFKFLDSGAGSFVMTDGACWVAWRAQPVADLVLALRWLKRVMVRDYGIAAVRVEAAFTCIPEYRRHQTDRKSVSKVAGSRYGVAR